MNRYIDADLIPYEYRYSDMEYVSKEDVDAMPTADVRENVRGEWIEVKHTFLDQCSNCGYITADVTTNYCPNCGADMRGEA